MKKIKCSSPKILFIAKEISLGYKRNRPYEKEKQNLSGKKTKQKYYNSMREAGMSKKRNKRKKADSDKAHNEQTYKKENRGLNRTQSNQHN